MSASSADYCPVCGSKLQPQPIGGRERPQCPGCGHVHYMNPGSAAAGVVLDSDRRLLLIRRRIRPFKGDWALPAGYQEVDESPAETASREIREETGVKVEIVRLLDLLWVPDDPRKPANVAVFLCQQSGGILRPGSDALDARWFELNDLPTNLGFGNEKILMKHFRKELS